MWRDEHTGLYHTHYRLYDPQHVRWLTPDPAGYRDGQNLYRFYAGPNGVDPLGLDEKSARHHIEIAEGLYSRVQQRIRNTESGNEAAKTPEFIALTQQLYASYLKVRANAIDDVNNYLATTNAAFIKYDLAERMMRLGEVAAVGQISAKSELCDAKITSSLLSSNIDSLDTMITTAEYSGYAGNTILAATGVGYLALIAKHIAVNSAKQAVLFGIHKGVTYGVKETTTVVTKIYVSAKIYEAGVETIKQNVGEEYKIYVDPASIVITNSINVAGRTFKGVKDVTTGIGAYLLQFKNGKYYAGKGPISRMLTSIGIRTPQAKSQLEKATYIPTKTEKDAHILEYSFMNVLGKPLRQDPKSVLLNKINSQGKKIVEGE